MRPLSISDNCVLPPIKVSKFRAEMETGVTSGGIAARIQSIVCCELIILHWRANSLLCLPAYLNNFHCELHFL